MSAAAGHRRNDCDARSEGASDAGRVGLKGTGDRVETGSLARDRRISARSIDGPPTAGLTGVEGAASYVASRLEAIGLTEAAALDDELLPSGAEGRARRRELRERPIRGPAPDLTSQISGSACAKRRGARP